MWTSVMRVFDSLGKGRSRPVVTKKVMDTLQSADDMLDESYKMLHGIKSHLNPEAFDDYDAKRNKLYLAVVAVKSDIRDKEAEGAFFSTPEEKEMFYSQVQKIFQDCRTYHTDIISVSRQTHKRRMQALQDSTIQSVDTAQPQWEAAGSRSDPTQEGSVDPSGVDSSSRDESSSTNNRFIATIIQTPQDALAAGDELLSQVQSDGEGPPFRMVICGNKDRQVLVVDLEPNFTDQPKDGDALQVANMLMRSDPQSLADHQGVEIRHGSSFITSLVSTPSLNN